MKWLKKLAPLLKPAAIAAGAAVAGEIVADSVTAKSLVIPTSADKLSAMAVPVAMGAIVGVGAAWLYEKNPVMGAAVAGGASPLVMTAYRFMKPAAVAAASPAVPAEAA